MPPQLMERARSLVSGGGSDWTPPKARHAATVVMISDTGDGIQVYLQRRVRTMAFAAGMYVFPGGAVEAQDAQDAQLLASASPQWVAGKTLSLTGDAGIGSDTLEARCAAVRETEEETSHDLGDPLGLSYIAHWVTPEVEDRRYDTRFYAQRVNARQGVVENSGESDAHLWVQPQTALDEYEAGRMAMLPPTVAVLAAFAEAAAAGLTADQAIEMVAAKPIVPLMPSPVVDPNSESGVGWVLVDVRTGAQIDAMASAPAGSESGGVHTSRQSAGTDAAATDLAHEG